MTIFLRNISGRREILVVGVSHFLMTTPNSTTSEPYKHLRIVKAFMVRQIAPWRKCLFGCGRFQTFRPGFGFGQRYHLDRHGQLTLKQLRLSVLNEMHTNSFTGPTLKEYKQNIIE